MKKTPSSLNILPIAKLIDLDANPTFFDPKATERYCELGGKDALFAKYILYRLNEKILRV